MIYIGIDPDVEKSGVAIWSKGVTSLHNFDYMQLFESLQNFQKHKEKYSILVVIEKGETNKAIFNANKAVNKRVAAKIGVSVGRNFEATNVIEQFCKYLELDYIFFVPNKATPKFNNKFVQDNFDLNTKRTNEEQRDALRCIMKYILWN